MHPVLNEAIHDLAYAWGGPPARGRLRQNPEDFAVREIPLLEPAGTGEHVWLWVRKRGENTTQLAERLARHAGVHPRQVSFAGMKDRHAVTEQWFSVQLPGREAPDWHAMDSETITVLAHSRHTRKLRRGALRGNAFRIRVRNITGDTARLEQQLQRIAAQGVPNYFGEQRFGREGSNLETARRLFTNPQLRLSRNKRGIALSAARSLLFNRVLSGRVVAGTWNRALPGEALQLQGSHSFFVADSIDETLNARLERQDIHPTGPLHGRGETPAQGACRDLERDLLADCSDWMQGLEAAGLKQERRALRLVVEKLLWQWETPADLLLEFTLPAGAYATSVLREVVTDTHRERAVSR